MKKFLSMTTKIVIILLVLIVVIAMFREFESLTRPGRQPLSTNVTERESQFTVSDRADETRGWIAERLDQANP